MTAAISPQNLSIAEAILFGFNKWRKNIIFFLILSIILLFFNFFLSGLFNLQELIATLAGETSELLQNFGSIVSFILQMSLGIIILITALTNRNNIYFFVGILLVLATLIIRPIQITAADFISIFYPPEILSVPSESSTVNFQQTLVTISISNYLAQILLGIGTTRVGLKLCENSRVKFSDLFSDLNIFLEYLFASVIVLSLYLLGTILFIIPAIILALRLQFYGYFILDKKMGSFQAIRQSFRATINFELELLFLSFLFNFLFIIVSLFSSLLASIIIRNITVSPSNLLASIPSLIAIVTLLIVTPIQIVANAFIYRRLLTSGETIRQSQAIQPSSAFGRASFVIFLVIISPFVLIYGLVIFLFFICLVTSQDIISLSSSLTEYFLQNSFLLTVVLFLLVVLALPLVLAFVLIPSLSAIGTGLGIAGVFQKNRRRASALVGLAFNSTFLLYLLVIVIGITFILQEQTVSEKVSEGESLAKMGQIEEDITVYQDVQKINPNLISADSWNELCWNGSLHNYPADVMFACDKAVKLEPENGEKLARAS